MLLMPNLDISDFEIFVKMRIEKEKDIYESNLSGGEKIKPLNEYVNKVD